MAKSWEEINARIASGDAVVLTAEEFGALAADEGGRAEADHRTGHRLALGIPDGARDGGRGGALGHQDGGCGRDDQQRAFGEGHAHEGSHRKDELLL